MDLLGVHWVGVTEQNGKRLLLSILFIAAVVLVRHAIRVRERDKCARVVGLKLWSTRARNSSVAVFCGASD